MIKRFCDICGAEMEVNFNCITLNGKSGYEEDRRHTFCDDICYACAGRLIDTIEEMRAAHDVPGKEEA